MKVGYKSSLDKEEDFPIEIPKESKENNKYVVWHIEGGMGKNVAATTLLEPLFKKYKDRKIVVVASYPEIFINNPFVYRVYRVGMTSYFYDDYIRDKDTIIFRHEPYFQTSHIIKKKHLIENWADLLNVKYEGQFPSINFNLVQKQLPLNWLRDKPIFIIQTNGGPLQNQKLNYSWTRDMPWEIAQKVVDKFKDKYHIIQITRPGTVKLEGVEVVDFSMSNVELFGLVAISEKRLLIDSSLQHIAAALNLKSTVLWIGTSPINFGYSLHSNLVAFPPQRNVKLIDSYLFDYSFDGNLHECPYFSVEEMFALEQVLESVDKT